MRDESRRKRSGAKDGEEEVSPPEDLMREHGVLNRILLIYDESVRRLRSQDELSIDVIAGSADIIRLQFFVRMYRPHAAREDPILFPAFRRIVTPKEFDALGEQFEDKEYELFGKEGFEGIVAQVEKIAHTLGSYDLNQFTPPAT